jgi:hypothetical protein
MGIELTEKDFEFEIYKKIRLKYQNQLAFMLRASIEVQNHFQLGSDKRIPQEYINSIKKLSPFTIKKGDN